MNIMTRPHSVLLISAFQDENNKLFGQLRLETNHTYLYSISYEAQDRHRRREKEGREGGGEGRELEQLHASARNNLRPGDSLSSALASNWMITPPSPSRLELIRNPTVCAPPPPWPLLPAPDLNIQINWWLSRSQFPRSVSSNRWVGADELLGVSNQFPARSINSGSTKVNDYLPPISRAQLVTPTLMYFWPLIHLKRWQLIFHWCQRCWSQ